MLSLTNHSNAQAVLIKLLKYSGLNTDAKTICEELDKHPDYPSLLSVSDVLTSFKIENAAFRISYDELTDMPCPFLAYANSNGGELLVVTKMEGNNFFVSNEKWNRHKLKAEAFKQMFGGVVLIVEPGTEANYAITLKSSLTKIKSPAIAAGIALILVSALFFHTGYLANSSWQTLALTLFKTAGLITSILLLIQSVDTNNPLVQVLCQGGGKTDCNAILSSKAAKVFEGLTWSEVGFFYFAGTWLLLLFGGGSKAIWLALAMLNFISLPYTVYSIYYQARIAKQWCVLCCTVQALLWLEFVPLITRNSPSFVHGTPFGGEGWGEATWSTLFICLLSPVILWLLLKPLFLKIQQLQPLKQQLRTFKYNTELFNKLLTEQPKYAIPDEEWCIVLGNAQANNIITMVTNPYCPPCAKTHKLLDELLEQRDDIQARIVFTAKNIDNDIKTPVSRHLMALKDLPDKTVLRKALHDWYEEKQKNYAAWAKVYPVHLNEVEYYKIDKQKDWCQMAEVTATPTLLLNGYRLPPLYQLPDLKYMLE
jgi:uncharacterized membrane protein/thiol-disulfide isomerase/thioredoxin